MAVLESPKKSRLTAQLTVSCSVRTNQRNKQKIVFLEEEQSNKEIYVFVLYSHVQTRNLII